MRYFLVSIRFELFRRGDGKFVTPKEQMGYETSERHWPCGGQGSAEKSYHRFSRRLHEVFEKSVTLWCQLQFWITVPGSRRGCGGINSLLQLPDVLPNLRVPGQPGDGDRDDDAGILILEKRHQ